MLLLPMGFVGLALARRLPPDELKALIGVFVLTATWAPGLLLLGSHPEAANPQRRFFLLGGVVGAVNIALTPYSLITRQNAPASGVPTGLPSIMTVVQPRSSGP